jgi:hypothetical protein
MKCQHCKVELPDNNASGFCPSCGGNLFEPPFKPAGTKGPVNKPLYWAIFWAAFFIFPAITLLAASLRRNPDFLFLPIVGAVICGFALAKIFTKPPMPFSLSVFIMTVGVLAIYLGIIFVGCLVVVGSQLKI